MPDNVLTCGWLVGFIVRRVRGGAPFGQAIAPLGAGGRSDCTAIQALLQEAVGTEEVPLYEVTTRRLRLAFARFAETHSAASIARCWSTWNQFFGFLIAEELVAGNPMEAVAKPKVGRRTPEPLQGQPDRSRHLGGSGPSPSRPPC